jgi:hypothetical protein
VSITVRLYIARKSSNASIDRCLNYSRAGKASQRRREKKHEVKTDTTQKEPMESHQFTTQFNRATLAHV